jgi:hypothetical protein
MLAAAMSRIGAIAVVSVTSGIADYEVSLPMVSRHGTPQVGSGNHLDDDSGSEQLVQRLVAGLCIKGRPR